MNGFEVIKKIKLLNNKCRFFVISNHSEEEVAEELTLCGAHGYLELPVEREHIAGVFSFLKLNKDR